jgi:hypothetical protein
MEKWTHKPESKTPAQGLLGLLFPLYAVKNDKRPVTTLRVVLGLTIGILLLFLSARGCFTPH